MFKVRVSDEPEARSTPSGPGAGTKDTEDFQGAPGTRTCSADRVPCLACTKGVRVEHVAQRQDPRGLQ